MAGQTDSQINMTELTASLRNFAKAPKNLTLLLHLIRYINVVGIAVAQWLRCGATNRKVTCLIPASVIRIFH